MDDSISDMALCTDADTESTAVINTTYIFFLFNSFD